MIHNSLLIVVLFFTYFCLIASYDEVLYDPYQHSHARRNLLKKAKQKEKDIATKNHPSRINNPKPAPPNGKEE
jgi:hypothetical protein